MKKYILFVAMTFVGLLGFTSVSHAQGSAITSIEHASASFAQIENSVANAAKAAAIKNLAFDAGKIAAFSGSDTHVLTLPAGKIGSAGVAVTNIPVKGASQSLLPRVSEKKAKATNIVTPGGMLPMYVVPSGSDIALPISSNKMFMGDSEASRTIADLLTGTGKFEGAGDFYRLAEELPVLTVISHGQLTVGQMRSVQEFYSGCLEGFGAKAYFWQSITREQWLDMVTVMTDVGFFGRAEDVDRIFNLVKDAPQSIRKLTDYAVVRTLLNMNERGIGEAGQALVKLAHLRATQEKWFEAGVPQSEKTTEMIYGEVRRYLGQTTPESPLLSALPNADTSAVDFALTPRESALLETTVQANFVTSHQFMDLSSLDRSLWVLNDFLRMKEKMPSLLPDLAR